MIQQLLDQIVTLLQGGFTGVIPDVANRIGAGPTAEPTMGNRPTLALYLDQLTFGKQFRESSSSSPRPQTIRETLAINGGTPAGPYTLAKTPLRKTMRCTVVYDEGALTERHVSLQEDDDFTIDYGAATLTFSFDVAGADTMRLTYSFVGVFTIREFQQDFFLDVYDDDMAGVEQWASLAAAMILTNHDELVAQYNDPSTATAYTANQFVNTHTVDQILLLDGNPDFSGDAAKMQFRFQVHGQLKPVKEIVDGFALIEKVRSPGRPPEGPLDIDIEAHVE